MLDPDAACEAAVRVLGPSLRSRRQRKAWGASPRKWNIKENGTREAGGSLTAVARFTGSFGFLIRISWGLRPRLYATACFAGS